MKLDSMAYGLKRRSRRTITALTCLLLLGTASGKTEGFQAPNQDDTRLAHETVERINRIYPLPVQADIAVNREFYSGAPAVFRVSEKSIEDFRFFFREGKTLEESGRLAEAEEAYGKALILAGNDEEKLKAYLALADVAVKRKEWDDAREAFLSALKLYPENPEIMRSLAKMAYAAKDYHETTLWIRRSLALKPDRNEKEFLANVLYLLKDYRAAIKELNQLLDEFDSGEDRHRIYMSLGYAYFGLEEFDKAAEIFREALNIKDDISTFSALVQSLESGGRQADAVAHLEEILKRNPTAETHLRLGLILAGTDETEKALHHLNESVKGDLPVKSRALAHKQMGFIYYGTEQYSDARSAFEEALALSPEDHSLYSAFAETLMRLEAFEDAKEYLEKGLALAETTLLLDAAAKIYRREGRFQKAIDALIKANAKESIADRHYRLGLNYKDLGKVEKAIIHFEEAAAMEPENDEFAVALGYSYKDAGRFKEAISLFEAVIRRNPDYSGLDQELGYMHMHVANNEQAVSWFKRAIDREALRKVESLEEAKDKRLKIYNMRKEVSKLTNRFDFTAYLTIRSEGMQNIPSAAQAGFASAVLPSDGGIEVTYQPPLVGFRDERVFQVFGRILGVAEPSTLDFDGDSVQGGIGMRYKPIKTHNLNFSVEKLFKVGDNSLDSWLLRVLYSKDYGYDLKFDEKHWNYSLLFVDLGYFTRRPDILAFYGEVRQGLTFNVRNLLLVTPHLVLDGRYQDPNNPGSTYIEGGIGLSLKYLFNETRYETHRSSLEGLIYYKYGKFFEGDITLNDDTFNGLVVTAIFRF